MKEDAIAIKRGKAWKGTLEGTTFTPTEELGKVDELAKNDDIDWTQYYIELHDFLVLSNPDQKKRDSEAIRKEIGYTKVYIYVEDNDDFWAYTNHKCNTCKRKCKQSSKVELVSCPQYEPI